MPDAQVPSSSVNGIRIRPETADDMPAITRVVEMAFATDAEARLVDAIRESDRFIAELSLVAEEDGEIVGHVMISHADLHHEGEVACVAILAPVAVAPEAQGRGIGAALVRESVNRADQMGEPMVVLEGSPRYYERLGFEPSSRHGIHMDLPDWAPPEAAQVIRLSRYDPSMRGRLVLPPAFDGVT